MVQLPSYIVARVHVQKVTLWLRPRRSRGGTAIAGQLGNAIRQRSHGGQIGAGEMRIRHAHTNDALAIKQQLDQGERIYAGLGQWAVFIKLGSISHEVGTRELAELRRDGLRVRLRGHCWGWRVAGLRSFAAAAKLAAGVNAEGYPYSANARGTRKSLSSMLMQGSIGQPRDGVKYGHKRIAYPGVFWYKGTTRSAAIETR
jgi:hypothetical protein